MTASHLTALVLSATLVACGTNPGGAAPAKSMPETDEDRMFYALGLAISQNLARYELTDAELAMVQAGLSDGVQGNDPLVDMDEYGPRLADLARARAQAAADSERMDSAEFLVAQAKLPGAVSHESGLLYFEVSAGEGPSPAATDTVEVHYHGTLRDGTVFDSSVDRGTPATFPLNRVIPCWTEALQKMKVGGKAKIVCPADIAYGDRGAPPKIAPGAALVFDVELLSIQ